MKTVPLQAEEILLNGSPLSDSPSDMPPCLQDAQTLNLKIRALMAGTTAGANRDSLLEICDLALDAYRRRGASRDEILMNPATPVLTALMLLVLDRCRDGFRAQEKIHTVGYWRTAANALFLVRSSVGRPGPFGPRQKSAMKGAYSDALARAMCRGKDEKQAHKIALSAAYGQVMPYLDRSGSDTKKLQAQVKRIIASSGLRPVRHRMAPTCRIAIASSNMPGATVHQIGALSK